jgi:aminopeptidase N
VLDATATQPLSRFDLDLADNTVASVAVNGAAAGWQRSGPELVISPRAAIADGARFSVEVTYRGRPRPARAARYAAGWYRSARGWVLAAQPDAAHTVFPSDDHPTDKASYTVRLTAPAATTAVANGTLSHRATSGGETTWTYDMPQPLAAELVQIAVGDFDVVDRGEADGVRLRDVVRSGDEEVLAPVLRRTRQQLGWLSRLVGPFPFANYGVLAAYVKAGFGLETQTLSLISARDLDGPPRAFTDQLMVHELAHQWFGDSVSPARRSDVWLNEGHATWYQWLWASEHGWLDLEGKLHAAYAHADDLRARYGPVARPRSATNVLDLFNQNVYSGGALVLYALRQEVGIATFEAIERAWVQEHRGGSASTDDFIALASRVAGRELGPFLRAWLYGTTVPRMPGHPGWAAADHGSR